MNASSVVDAEVNRRQTNAKAVLFVSAALLCVVVVSVPIYLIYVTFDLFRAKIRGMLPTRKRAASFDMSLD